MEVNKERITSLLGEIEKSVTVLKEFAFYYFIYFT